MEFLLGMTGKDFTLTISDTAATRSIIVFKNDEDKSLELNKHVLMLYSGSPGDTLHFAEYIQRNVKLYEIKNGIELTPKATATFTRREMATSLRSRKPYIVNLLIAGYDVTTSLPHLYWIDHLGTNATMPYAAHGYGAFYTLGILDKYHRPDISLDEAKAIAKKCIEELKTRFFTNLSGFKVKVSDKDGIREIEI